MHFVVSIVGVNHFEIVNCFCKYLYCQQCCQQGVHVVAVLLDNHMFHGCLHS